MISVVFVCLGNICRSPMAELIFLRLAAERAPQLKFDVVSRGTSDEEEDNPIYPPAAKVLREHGITGAHRARQLVKREVVNADYVLVMDSSNLFDVLRLTGGQFSEKVFKLGSFSEHPHDISDPWFTRDFEKAYRDIYACCERFIEFLLKKYSN